MRRDTQRILSLLKSKLTRPFRFKGWFLDTILMNLPHDQCLDIAKSFSNECVLCSCGSADRCDKTLDHYTTCPFISHTTQATTTLKSLHRLEELQKDFRGLSEILYNELRRLVLSFRGMVRSRVSLSENVIDALIYIYLSDLSNCGHEFDFQQASISLRSLPTQRLTLPHSITPLPHHFVTHIHTSHTVPLEVVILRDLHHFPPYFLRWHLLTRSELCSRDFGGISDIRSCLQHDVTSLLVFSDVSPTLIDLINDAIYRARHGGRTWIPHRDPLNNLKVPKDPLIEIRRIKVGQFWFTCIQHYRWMSEQDSTDTTSFPPTTHRPISQIHRIGLIFPSIGEGRFSRLIPISRIPSHHRALVKELRQTTSIELFLGLFGPLTINAIDTGNRKIIRTAFFRVGVRFLRFTYLRRKCELWKIFFLFR